MFRLKRRLLKSIIPVGILVAIIGQYNMNEHFHAVAKEGMKLIVIDHDDPFDMEEFCELISPEVKDFYLEAKDFFDTAPTTVEDIKGAMDTVSDTFSSLDDIMEMPAMEDTENTEDH